VKLIRGRVEEAGQWGDKERFTGGVMLDRMAVIVDGDGPSAGDTLFVPGARCHWHSHAGGQILIVKAGEGYVQTSGAPKHLVRAGDIVYFSPGEKSWHGASERTYFVHTAISFGETSWFEEANLDSSPGESRQR